MRRSALVLGVFLAGCGGSVRPALIARTPAVAETPAPIASGVATTSTIATEPVPEPATSEEHSSRSTETWIGASAESTMVLAGVDETVIGVWVDAPSAREHVRPPVDVALVVDTSGSMGGDKISNARRAAASVIQNLRDGDIVSLDAFSDDASVLSRPVVLGTGTRRELLRAVSRLQADGSTNLFAGLSLGESQVAMSPATHLVRRVVLISDGMANIGPSTPEALGVVAERGLRFQTQVTCLGVGVDYHERTLNALAVRSSGRLYHLGDPSKMASILRREMDLLGATVAGDAFVEVVPAPGVELLPVAGGRTEWGTKGALRIPLGSLFGGQHREALVRARFKARTFIDSPRPLASVRLHYRDPAEGDLERVQEVIARVQATEDGAAVRASMSSRTRSIIAIQDAAKLEMHAAENVNSGNFDDADRALAAAESKLSAEAAMVSDATEQRRLSHAASTVAAARTSTRASMAAPPAQVRNNALELNSAGMSGMGY